MKELKVGERVTIEAVESFGDSDQCKVIDSSNDLKHPCYRILFSSSLLTLMDDDDFSKHFLSFLKNEKKLNEEMFNNL